MDPVGNAATHSSLTHRIILSCSFSHPYIHPATQSASQLVSSPHASLHLKQSTFKNMDHVSNPASHLPLATEPSNHLILIIQPSINSSSHSISQSVNQFSARIPPFKRVKRAVSQKMKNGKMNKKMAFPLLPPSP